MPRGADNALPQVSSTGQALSRMKPQFDLFFLAFTYFLFI